MSYYVVLLSFILFYLNVSFSGSITSVRVEGTRFFAINRSCVITCMWFLFGGVSPPLCAKKRYVTLRKHAHAIYSEFSWL